MVCSKSGIGMCAERPAVHADGTTGGCQYIELCRHATKLLASILSRRIGAEQHQSWRVRAAFSCGFVSTSVNNLVSKSPGTPFILVCDDDFSTFSAIVAMSGFQGTKKSIVQGKWLTHARAR